jgi:hypothetical protein
MLLSYVPGVRFLALELTVKVMVLFVVVTVPDFDETVSQLGTFRGGMGLRSARVPSHSHYQHGRLRKSGRPLHLHIIPISAKRDRRQRELLDIRCSDLAHPSSTSGNVSTSGTTVTFTVNANANSLAVGT